MKEKLYYLILLTLTLSSLAIGYFFDLNFKYWIGSIGILVLYIWCKKEFTGKIWFEKTMPKLPKEPSPVLSLAGDEYEKYVEANYPLLAEQEKSGYISLVKLCLAPNRQNDLISDFEKLRDYSQDERYMTTLNYVMEYSDEQNLFFIMALDWKQDIETLEWRLKNSLYKNFGLSIELPNPTNYEKLASVSFENIFEDYDKPLRNQGLQMGFIDTQSDEYVIFVHKLNDREKIKNAVNKIGYKYYDK
jgi:hypothetical protein